MDTIHLTLSANEADMLHSLLVLRRHAFTKFCLQFFHSSPTIQQYIHELKALEAKLMQLTPDEYEQVPEFASDDDSNSKHFSNKF